jgi:hypothetical protein
VLYILIYKQYSNSPEHMYADSRRLADDSTDRQMPKTKGQVSKQMRILIYSDRQFIKYYNQTLQIVIVNPDKGQHYVVHVLQ